MGTGNSVIAPVGVTRPILLPANSVNQRLPSAPVVITRGSALRVGRVHSLTPPEGVIRPTLLALISANQTFPSGPELSPCGQAAAVTVLKPA